MLKTWASPPTGAVSRCAELGTGKIEFEKIITEELRAVPLHYCPELVEACADLINEEWKRSKASRIHSLQKSSNSFPLCLVLKKILNDVGNTNNENKSLLVGHSRLSRVVGKSTGLFVETVIVAKEFRGKGYGRKLMEATEAYAKHRGFKTLYLTTHDKQDFYSHLGYVLTEPVQNAGSMTSFMNMEFLEKLSPPSVSPPINSHSLPPPCPPWPSPQVPSLAPGSAPAQKHRLNLPSPSHPFTSSQSNASVTFPSSLIASSSQSGQLQSSTSCSSATSPSNKHVPIPPPPPLPPPLPGAQPAPPSLITPQLHGHTHPCNSSSPSPTLPISQTSQLHSLSALQLSSPPADSVAMLPTPPPLPGTSETLTKLSQFPCHSPESFKENRKATQTLLETPYRCIKGLPVFWMKKDI
ncbi:serine/threonine-protein kinase WNK4-like isoform X3 [Pristis pectinata]|uniref:serine/threonine-protein kinase WNK4-like isoform X3 n=1 Tax=Pristis pectinata TaxID=685728 RepID=UPI00223D45AA|nr:serine/threonine-protein kinase WNK4-like isoform X3 [Pristis pectinata]